MEISVNPVEQLEQMQVVRHELVFTVRHVHRGELKVVEMVALDEPPEGKGIPHDLSFSFGADLLDRLLHVAADDGVVAPAVVEHQMVAQAGVVDDHLQPVFAQVAESLDLYVVLLRRGDALGEECDSMTAIVPVGVVEACRQTEGEVCLASLQVVKGFLTWFEADDIRDIQLLQQLLDQVDVKAFWLPFVVEKGIGPQI